MPHRSPRPSGPRAAAALLLLPLLLAACAGESAPAAAPAAPASAPATTTADDGVPPAVPTPAQAVDEESAQVVELVVAGGKVTGSTGRVPVELGTRVRLTVVADVTDEIHVHGYDLHEDTLVGRPAALEFVADRPGVFEVELEESRVLLTRLQVQ